RPRETQPGRLAMIFRLFRQSSDSTIDVLYGAIVAQARLPVFYCGLGVPDTVEARFDTLVLHLVLVVRRVRREPDGTVIAQGLFDAFCRDLDHSLREMGVGGLSVPREMKRLVAAFYGRQRAYEEALVSEDPHKLAEAVGRNVLGAIGPQAEALA